MSDENKDGAGQRRPVRETERRLLESARDTFAEKGYYGTSTREIAAGAGMSPAAMYIHFASKQEILARLSLEGHVSALDALQAGAHTSGSPTKRLRSAIYAFAHWHAENHTTGRVVQYELSALDDGNRSKVVELRRETAAALHKIVYEGVRSGEFAVDQIDVATLALLSLCIDTVRWYPSVELHTPEAVGATFAGLAERMVKASG